MILRNCLTEMQRSRPVHTKRLPFPLRSSPSPAVPCRHSTRLYLKTKSNFPFPNIPEGSGPQARVGRQSLPVACRQTCPLKNRRGAASRFSTERDTRRNHRHERQHQPAGCIPASNVSVVIINDNGAIITGIIAGQCVPTQQARSQIGNPGAASGTIATCSSRRENCSKGSRAAHVRGGGRGATCGGGSRRAVKVADARHITSPGDGRAGPSRHRNASGRVAARPQRPRELR
jgi:hypothetical protein